MSRIRTRAGVQRPLLAYAWQPAERCELCWAHQWWIAYNIIPTMARIAVERLLGSRARCGLGRVLEALLGGGQQTKKGGARTSRNEVGSRRAGAPLLAQKAAKTFFFLSLYRAQSVPSSSS